MSFLKITPEIAQKIIVNAQFLNGQNQIPSGKEGLMTVLDKLGYVQIDTISVVNRAHHQTFWARTPNYSEELLFELQKTDRKIFEYWSHAMSYLPMADFRYCLPRMRKFKNPKSHWITNRIEICKPIINDVFKRVKDEGPLSSKDFEKEAGKKGGTWWDWKPAKIALEILYWQGKLMISERHNFQKVYDLTERVLPSDIDTSFPTEKETAEYIVLRATKALGVVGEKEIYKFLQPGATRDSDMLLACKKAISNTLKKLVESNQIIPVKIDQIGTDYYGLPEIEGQINNSEAKKNVRFLSPFDNLIIQRERAKQLFDFEYSLECYTPAPKRKFGYFVFSILWGHQIIARFDPKADRKNKLLIINNLQFEEKPIDFDQLLPVLAAEFVRFAHFHLCQVVIFENCLQIKKLAELQHLIKVLLSNKL